MADYKKKAEEGKKKQNNKEGKKDPADKDKKLKENAKEQTEKEKQDKEKQDKEKEKKDKEEKPENPPLDPKTKDKLLRIHIGVLDDPKSVEIMFQDKLPPETKELEVDDAIANKESSNNDYMNYIKKGEIRRQDMEERFPPEKSGDYIKISQLRYEQFFQEDEKARQMHN